MEEPIEHIEPYKQNEFGNVIFPENLKRRLKRFQKIKKISEMSDEDLRELILIIMEMLQNQNFTELVFGVKFLNKKTSKKISDKMFTIFRKFLKAIAETEKYPENPDKVEQILKKAIDDFLKEVLGKEVLGKTPIIEYLIESFNKKILNVKGMNRFFKNTEFSTYFKLACELIDEINNNHEKRIKLDDLLKNELVVEDGLYELLTSSKLLTNIELLHKPIKKWTTEKLQKVNDAYGSLASIYEKQVRLINAMIRIANGDNKIDYNKIYNDNLANNVRFIKHNKKYGKLGEFDLIMRNAIHHSNILPNINTQTVTYKDRKGSVTYNYTEVLNQTRNLSALIYSLISMNNYAQYLKWVQFKKTLEEQESKNKLVSE